MWIDHLVLFQVCDKCDSDSPVFVPDERSGALEELVVPLVKRYAYVRYEAAAALKMLHCGVENILAPADPFSVIEAIEREVNKGFLADEIIHSISNHEMAVSKVFAQPAVSMQEAFALAKDFCNKK